jgi:hypothetical protein
MAWTGFLGGGSGMSDEENGNGPPEQTTDLDRLVHEALDEAAEKEREEAKYEAGNDSRNIVQGLVIGPQAYRDPGWWSPNYNLYPESSPERQAFEQGTPTPLAQDKSYLDTLGMIDRINRGDRGTR